MLERSTRFPERPLASPRDDAQLDRALIVHTYDLMTSEGIGGAFVGGALTLAIAWDDTGFRYATWAALQLLAMVTNLGVFGWYKTGRFGDSALRMRAARRLGVFVTGVTWGVGSILFPLGNEIGLGFAIFFCYAGLCGGAAATLAGDPVAYALFAATTVTPAIVSAFDQHWWISVLVLAYLLVMLGVVYSNHRALAESLRLRFENADLLRLTIEEREIAVEARAQAERAGEAKTKFLAAASHDLRQPVQALSLFVDLLQRDPTLDPRERARAIESLGRTTDAMRAMLEALLDISRLDAGLVSATPVAVRLAPLLDEIVMALRDEAESYDMVVHAAGRDATVSADLALLSRVLHNLATNAVRHARRGRVLLAVRHRGAHVVVQVYDQGHGIADEDRERIFDEYVQLENRERDRRKGLGLGLPMVRRICELSGFPLALETNVGRGTMFSVTLPRADVETRRDSTGPWPTGTRALRVVLVEDDALVREAVAASLTAVGHHVHVAHNVEDARRAIARLCAAGTPPEALVTDHRLPGEENGADLVRSLQTLPAVLLTGDVDVPRLGDDTRARVAVLRKPVSGDALFEAIRRVTGAT